MLYRLLENFNNILWGLPLLIGVIFIGIYYSIRTRFFQLRYLPNSLKNAFAPNKNNSCLVSPFAAACTALSATIGTGNIAGVAGAISLGGAGAVFWMLVTAFLGMIIKLAETTLAIRYKKGSDDTACGGPMYYIKYGLTHKLTPLATLFSVFGIIAAFGSGNAIQINTVAASVSSVFQNLSDQSLFTVRLISGIIMSALSGIVLLGGIKRITSAAEKIVPLMIILYILLASGVIIIHIDRLPEALSSVFIGAFSPRSVTAGAVGSVFITAQKGIARGIFSNEAGLGTSAIAHAAADTSSPVHQGLFGIFEVFIDTVLICTLTALVILCGCESIPYGIDTGIHLTLSAFAGVYGRFASPLLCILVCFFAFSSVIGWGLYGISCIKYLLGENMIKPFLFLFCAAGLLGAVTPVGAAWLISEICNGLMALPNLISLILLSPEVFKEIKEFEKNNALHFESRVL